ncbi:hypothetical protein LOTGIDRAFT_165846 [Lottia gigantea]|uniref:Uncharacterized protein n=1 Tax=Lottia gigantea TaxID=225164 RepID=V4BHH5_LOTGI|nr:hypothetical protein LOTGIDRAFT_165846 [Lottia gigantea]ESO88109.1 hypothetical protein LOTGIDRAFT_165846 [Lottia gigantea]
MPVYTNFNSICWMSNSICWMSEVLESGSVLMWGYCKALGRKYDILTPEVADIPYPVIQVAGGSSHSMALTENGHIYVWGSGIDGQLGKSKKLVIDAPKRLKDPNLFGNTVVIACGESFNAALTQCGQLYMWGKNNDTINATKKTSHKQFEPVLMNGDYKDISLIKCGGWHAMALTGRPETTIIENTDSLTDESTSETESIEAVELKPEITDMNLKTKEDENGNTLLVSPPPVSHLHSNAKKKYSRQTIGEFYESKEPPGNTCLNVDESTKICNPGKIQNKCHEATSQLTSLPTEATTSEVIPADSKVLVSPNNNKAGSVHYLIEFHGNSLIKSDNSANQNSHTNKHGKCKPAFFLLSQKTNNSVDCADQKELNEPQNRNSELSEKIITNSKNNTNSKISLDFQVKSKDSLYKERVFVSQRDMKLKAVDDLKLKTLFDDLFEHGSSDKLSEDKKQRLKVLYEAIVPGSRHLSSLSDAESKPPARRFGLSNNHHKPPSVPRDRTYLKYNTGKKIREVGDKAKQQKIGTQPSNQKPIFSSASSWKKRPLLRGQTYCESSPSHMNSKQLVRNTKQRSTSASSQQCHEPKLLLRRKLSS